MKFGKVKREHGRVRGLDEICDRIIKECNVVSRIVPGRINRRRGNGPKQLKVQYATPAGLKCQYTIAGSVQEVFLICTDEAAAEAWLKPWIKANKLTGG